MIEWNGIFRLFRFSGILGQPREVLPKFRNEIPENVCSGIFGRVESAPGYLTVPLRGKRTTKHGIREIREDRSVSRPFLTILARFTGWNAG